MSWLTDLLTRFTEAFKWAFVLEPWEQALRVRAGKWVTKFEGGIHFRIPYLDNIFKQNCRMRISDMGSQVITTKDLKTITLAGTLRYKIKDVTPLYMKLHSAEETIVQYVQAIVTEYITDHVVAECHPSTLIDYVNNRLNFEQFGLVDVFYALTDFANVRTYRLINQGFYSASEHTLKTDTPEGAE